MAKHARAQERLFALREMIAKLESKVPTLMAEEQRRDEQEAGADRLPYRTPIGIHNIDAALDEGLPWMA